MLLKNASHIALIAALGGFLFGFEVSVISGAEQTIQQLWKLDSFWLGFTVASSLIGTVLGSIAVGRPAQAYGRNFISDFCIGMCSRLFMDVLCVISVPWRCGSRGFICRGANVYFGNCSGPQPRKIGRNVSVEYCRRNPCRLFDQLSLGRLRWK